MIPCNWTLVVPVGAVKGTADQVEPPVHCSTRAALGVPDAPTAMQKVALVQSTWLSTLPVVFGLVVGTTDQTEPFHISASVTTSLDALVAEPTAMQKLGPTQDTEVRLTFVSPEGFDEVTMDQVDPFHISARLVVAGAVPWEPTAMHMEEPLQETWLAELDVDAPGEVSAVVDQFAACT